MDTSSLSSGGAKTHFTTKKVQTPPERPRVEGGAAGAHGGRGRRCPRRLCRISTRSQAAPVVSLRSSEEDVLRVERDAVVMKGHQGGDIFYTAVNRMFLLSLSSQGVPLKSVGWTLPGGQMWREGWSRSTFCSFCCCCRFHRVAASIVSMSFHEYMWALRGFLKV